MKDIFKNYPLVDGHRTHYCLHLVKGTDGEWRCAEVLEDGFLDPENNPAKISFYTEAECKRACDIHNNYHGFDAMRIIAASMNNCLSN